ncbi:SDR family NAD(P)-dependent oxidoreductase [Flagellimonas sp.]|uniref:SDR family NAD(P)-dependent oxidoreductase n=1 Tax=Flagellimonas sp. TaxID=2058762 RepID=UPI003F4A3A77
MKREVAIIGMECIYPGADNYLQLWENIKYGRKAFRKMPQERMNHNYFSESVDGIYQDNAGLICNYHFDREKFKIPLETFESTDFCHWMALDIAYKALADSGVHLDETLRKSTAVFVGNSLTGEQTRSNLMRLRWPYVFEVLNDELKNLEWSEDRKKEFLEAIEKKYKSPFPEMKEDSLAGGLSNTIAGRICNYFDFNGGGYTTDGACGSSLLSLVTAVKDIQQGHIDMALAGGVDISLDPFELVGFSRAGALTQSSMQVFSKASKGFIPGEGCGFVVLMEANLARSKNLEIYSLVNGYGLSSDGAGGLTRPKAETQVMAISKAYPGDSIKNLKYVEAHGTGTVIGDKTELSALINIIGQKTNDKVRVGALKELIGHSKAASGVAGFIKAVLVTKNRFIPAQSTNKDKHELLTGSRPLDIAAFHERILEKDFVTGVSAFGFGGLNVHVSLKNNSNVEEVATTVEIPRYQDCELMLFAGKDMKDLQEQVAEVLEYAKGLSIADVTDLGHHLYQKLDRSAPVRLALIASNGGELAERLGTWLEYSDEPSGKLPYMSWSETKKDMSIGYLFPGQGSKNVIQLPIYRNRYACIEEIITSFDLPDSPDSSDAAIVQPTIVRNSAIALSILDDCNITAKVGLGHSLGELSALYWSGTISVEQLKHLAQRRGAIMKTHCNSGGTMYSIEANEKEVLGLINGYKVDIACKNSTHQTVVAGPEEELLKMVADQETYRYTPLKVTHPFHSRLMNPGVDYFKAYVSQLSINNPSKKVQSPTSGRTLKNADEIRKMLTDQFTNPVNFYDTMEGIDDQIDLWVEVGSGTTLSGIAAKNTDKPIFAVDLFNSMRGILDLMGYLFVHQSKVNIDTLFKGRFFREFPTPYSPSFITNPCESLGNHYDMEIKEEKVECSLKKVGRFQKMLPLDALRKVVANKLDLPLSAIAPESRMLDDLHLNSIVVANLLSEVMLDHGYSMRGNPTEFSNASIAEIASSLEYLENEDQRSNKGFHWIRAFEPTWKPKAIESRNAQISIAWEQLLKVPIVFDPGHDILMVQFRECDEERALQRLDEMVKLVKENIPGQLVLVQDKNWASGWAKSYFQEHGSTQTLVVEIDNTVNLVEILDREMAALKGFTSVKYANRVRYEQFLNHIELDSSQGSIMPSDLVLAVGGAKGITAECAIELAKKYRNKTVILGRSKPFDNAVTAILDRYTKLGLDCRYYSCDISSWENYAPVLKAIQHDIGPVNYLLHGAGTNTPVPFTNLTLEHLGRTLSPKYEGLKNLLNGDYPELKAVVTFGSIIEYSGMKGNADYALANGLMNNRLQEYARSSGVRCLNIAWSVWSGTGMGDRLGVLNTMRRQDIQPIGVEEGTSWFIDCIDAGLENSVVITGKFGTNDTLRQSKGDLPKLHFLSDLVAWYPEVELIAEIDLDIGEHLYLKHHVINDTCVLPTVIAVEAMVEAARVLSGVVSTCSIEDLQLNQPVIIPEQGQKIVLNALKEGDEITITLVNPITQVKYMQASIYMGKPRTKPIPEYPGTMELDAGEVYDALLFHSGHFNCLKAYHYLTPYAAVASVSLPTEKWLKSRPEIDFIIGNPGVNDAMLHMVQACVPHHDLLPHSIGKIVVEKIAQRSEALRIHATENFHEKDIYSYDISLVTTQGEILVQYQDARFKVVKSEPNTYPILTESLVPISLSRIAGEQSLKGMEFLLKTEIPKVSHRGDGKPMVDKGYISISHCDDLDLAVRFSRNIGCDIEKVVSRPTAIWKRMLKGFDHKSPLTEDIDVHFTRMWTIAESLRKMGQINLPDVEFQTTGDSGALLYRTKTVNMVSWVFRNYRNGQLYALAFAVELPPKPEPFKYRHMVSFEETNLVGNVYFSNFIKWQGLCREAFLHKHLNLVADESTNKVPISSLLGSGKLALVTLNTSCNYFKELKAFDNINIHLLLEGIEGNRIKMKFRYYLEGGDAKEELVAEGKQEIACMERNDQGGMDEYRDRIPLELVSALEPFAYE